ncbi:MAG: SprB repeat-containing protein [Flavobacteriales bacterium]
MLQGTVQVLQGLSCADEADARAVVQASGGVPPYSYNWKHGEMGDTAWSIPAGNHFVGITDANQKTIQVLFEIQEPEPLEVRAKAFVYANMYNTSCHNCANGKIMTNVTGGTAPYTYAWYNDEEELISTEANPEQLEAGKYYLSVYDAHQCKAKGGAHILPAPRDDWSMEGNEGLDAASHFIGTTDSTALVFHTNYQEAIRIEGDGTVKVVNKLLLPEGSTGVVLKTESGEIELLTTEGLRDIIYQTIQLPCVAENPSGMPDWQREVGKIYTGHPICRTAVGVNTSHPQANLHVVGDVILGDNGSWHSNQPTVRINANENKALLINSEHENDGRIAFETLVNRNKTKAIVVNKDKENFIVYGDGTTVIGHNPNISPDSETMLAVEGLISSRGIKVTDGPYPDYVFEPDYQRMSIEDIKAFIEKYNHLPGVTPAATIEQEGSIDLGRMSLETLKLLEELYLLVIELNEKVKSYEK